MDYEKFMQLQLINKGNDRYDLYCTNLIDHKLMDDKQAEVIKILIHFDPRDGLSIGSITIMKYHNSVDYSVARSESTEGAIYASDNFLIKNVRIPMDRVYKLSVTIGYQYIENANDCLYSYRLEGYNNENNTVSVVFVWNTLYKNSDKIEEGCNKIDI